MRVALFLLLILGMIATLCCQDQVQQNNKTEKVKYLGQIAPRDTPMIFAPGIISLPDRYEFGCTISKNGEDLYFGVDNNGVTEIYHRRFSQGSWSEETQLFALENFGHNDPMLSPQEDRLYFISNRPKEAKEGQSDIDLWYATREGDHWSDPINLGAPINNHLDQYYSSFTSDGSLYFSSRDLAPEAPSYAMDIYRSQWDGHKFLKPERLSDSINTARYEADVFVAPDESYLIFCSIRRDGSGQGDLYISFRNEDRLWSEAVSMGPLINTSKHELCPYVTPDGKYFFYTSDQDLYWVDASIFELYR